MPGLEDLDGRRRHRLAAPGRRTAACAPSTRKPATSASCPARTSKTNRNAYEMIRHDTIFTNVALTGRQRALVGRPRARHACVRLAGHALRSGQWSRRASEFALHGFREAEPELLAAGERRRACRSRRSSSVAAAANPRAAGVPGARLGPWRAGRRRHGLRDHGRGHRRTSAWCAATRWR